MKPPRTEPKRIRIPFHRDMQKAILDGRKWCTSRNKRYGIVGDTFLVKDKVYELVALEYVSLYEVWKYLYGAEGFSCPLNFKQKWLEIYPDKEINKENMVWVHFFAPEA